MWIGDGVNGGVVAVKLFIVDDIVLFSPTAKGLKKLIRIVMKHCDMMKMSVSENYVAKPNKSYFKSWV